MAELEYFAANDPQRFDRRDGRILTAGVLLLLVGLALGAVVAMAGVSVLTLRHRAGDWSPMVFLFAGLASCALATLGGGVGLLVRRRWAGPVSRVGVSVWLAGGVATAGVATLLGVIEEIRRFSLTFYLHSGIARLFWDLAVPLGIFYTSTVGLPLLLHVLLRPDDVRRTLELHDHRPRWTDGRSVGRGVVVALLTALGGVTGWCVLMDWQSRSYAYSHYEQITVMIASHLIAAVLSIAAAACALFGRRSTDWAAVALAGLVVAAFAYVCLVRHAFTRYLYTDRVALIGGFIVVAAIAAMLLLRHMKADADASRETRRSA